MRERRASLTAFASGKACETLSWVSPFVLIIALDTHHVTDYHGNVIRTFADKHTQQLFLTGKSKRLPADVIGRAIRRLEYIDLATGLDDLKVPPSNRLHALKGDRVGQHAISVNDQWRICFRWGKDDACDVEITDYH